MMDMFVEININNYVLGNLLLMVVGLIVQIIHMNVLRMPLVLFQKMVIVIILMHVDY